MKACLSAARVAALLLVLGCASAAQAADPPPTALYAEPKAAGDNPERTDELFKAGERIVRNVSQPSLTPVLPDPAKATGAAVIVAPGGGFIMLSFDTEGMMVARRLADRGIAAFVLKYRVEQTPDAPAAFMLTFVSRMRGLASRKTPELPPFAAEPLAAEDAAAAVRLVRSRAGQWGLDPKRIGFLGFSAGAITGGTIATGEPSGRPDFVGLIYGALRRPAPNDAPPAFIAAAADDPLLKDASVSTYQAWRAAGRPAELHVFERGGHGFGAKPQGASSDHWLDEFLWWMESRGLLAPPARAAGG